jgi:hypothetical protein
LLNVFRSDMGNLLPKCVWRVDQVLLIVPGSRGTVRIITNTSNIVILLALIGWSRDILEIVLSILAKF